MTDTLVNVVNLGQPQQVPAGEGQTLREILEAAGVDLDSTTRFRGETLGSGDLDSVTPEAGDTVVAAPPQVSHGA